MGGGNRGRPARREILDEGSLLCLEGRIGTSGTGGEYRYHGRATGNGWKILSKKVGLSGRMKGRGVTGDEGGLNVKRVGEQRERKRLGKVRQPRRR